MLEENNETALSPGQALNGQRVLRIPRLQLKDNIWRIGTWNVRSLYVAGKVQNLLQEISRLKVDIMGVSEVKWTSSGIYSAEKYSMYYSCGSESDYSRRHGVGVVVNSEIKKAVTNFIPLSDRVMMLQINARPIRLNIIRVYAPTADKPEEEVEDFYEEITRLLKLTKKEDINIVLGDLNAKVGSNRVADIVGPFGIGDRNERGDRLVNFCEENDLVVSNTWFQLPARRLYTWKSPQDKPGHIVRNQIDFILINKRFRNFMSRVSTYPGADIGSDHSPVIANTALRFAKTESSMGARRIDTRKLITDERVRSTYAQSINSGLISGRLRYNVESDWNTIKDSLKSGADAVIGYVSKTKKQVWMTDEILQLMELRRQQKILQNQGEYNRIHRTIRGKIRQAKEKWMEERCSELENLQQKGDFFGMYKKTKEMAGVYRRRTFTTLTDEHGNPIINISEAWKNYTQSLFDDVRSSAVEIQGIEELSGPAILKSEVQYAIKTAKNNKAPGPDEVYAEYLKLVDGENLEKLTAFFNLVYDTGQIPQDWLRSTFVMLPKKPNASKCKDHRPICLMSHALKIFLKILHTRIFRKLETISGETQFGFKSGVGTREAIFCLNTLVQNCYDQRKNVYLCFIDYEKAFDSIKHNELMKVLSKTDVDEKDVRIIRNLYWWQTADVRLCDNSTTEEFAIRKGVRQGCILSPMLFNIYVENIFSEALDDLQCGIKVNGRPVNNIRYADDTVIIADNPGDLQLMLEAINTRGKLAGLKINGDKTKVMVISRDPVQPLNIRIDNKRIETVSQFKYLGSLVNDRWDPQMEIKSRIEQAKQAFLKYKKLFCDPNLSFSTKYRLVKCYVWSVLLYGMETWTLKVTSVNRLEACEMWILRRMLRISWTARMTNSAVLEMAGVQRSLFTLIKERKIGYLGHILRGEKYGLLRLILEGKIEGKRGIGRKSLSWLRNIREWTGLRSIGDLCRAAEARSLRINIIS